MSGSVARSADQVREHIRTKVTVDGNGCWNWDGAISHKGYGRIRWANKTRYTHRISYELFVGPIPDGLQIDHLCRNRACCNPDHLEPVTGVENVRRSPNTKATETHCGYGHEFNPQTLRIRDGRRVCIVCKAEHLRAWRRGITRAELDVMEGRAPAEQAAA